MYRLADSLCVQLHQRFDDAAGERAWNLYAEHYDDGAASGDAGGQFVDSTLLCDLAGGSRTDFAGRGFEQQATAPHLGNHDVLSAVCAAVAAARLQQFEFANSGERNASRDLHDYRVSDFGQRYEKHIGRYARFRSQPAAIGERKKPTDDFRGLNFCGLRNRLKLRSTLQPTACGGPWLPQCHIAGSCRAGPCS